MPAGTLVLLYHRVTRLNHDPYRFAVRPDRFAQQCEVLRQQYDVVPLSEADGTSRQVVITFDDGYVDNSQEARAILAAAGLPATFFITAGRLGRDAEVWWDRLEQIITRHTHGHLDVETAGRRLWADTRSPTARTRAHFALYGRLRPLPPHVIESILTQLESQLGIQTVDRETHRWMNGEELCALAETPGLDVGAHTVTHPFLTSLPAAEQRDEIHGSRQQLEEILGKPVNLFSYPYGADGAFDAVTVRLVRESGYTRACTALGGLADACETPFLVPRNVVGDWDAATFEQAVSRWFGG